jgi:hypothetical protein
MISYQLVLGVNLEDQASPLIPLQKRGYDFVSIGVGRQLENQLFNAAVKALAAAIYLFTTKS